VVYIVIEYVIEIDKDAGHKASYRQLYFLECEKEQGAYDKGNGSVFVYIHPLAFLDFNGDRHDTGTTR